MNDFTKTELREIKRCLTYMINGGTTPYSCQTIAVNKKVKEMYDNYDKPCGHKETNFDDGIYYCNECGMCM